jgi:hypothetical protein
MVFKSVFDCVFVEVAAAFWYLGSLVIDLPVGPG